MNWLEQIQIAVDAYWLMTGAIVGALLVLGAVAAALRIAGHNRRLGVRLARLESELTVYTEASTRVAESLEAVLMGRTRTSQSLHSSRRYLLLQARERLHRGETPQGIAWGLGLSHDEVRLLEHVGRSGLVRDSATAQRPRSSLESREGFVRPVSVELPEGGLQTDAAATADERTWGRGAR